MGILQKKYELGRMEVAFIIIILLALVGAGFYAWKLGRDKQAGINSFAECVAAGNPVMESYPEQCMANGRTWSNPDQVLNQPEQASATVSGQGGLSVVFPSDWTGIRRIMDSDWFIIPGTDQPRQLGLISAGISDSESYGGGGASVFSILIHDNFAEPIGVAADYTLVNGKDNPIAGKKYTHEYTEDTEEGLGARLKGDREYTYVFDIGDGKQLRIFYNVFVSDPRNLIDQAEAVIDSIKLLKY